MVADVLAPAPQLADQVDERPRGLVRGTTPGKFCVESDARAQQDLQHTFVIVFQRTDHARFYERTSDGRLVQ